MTMDSTAINYKIGNERLIRITEKAARKLGIHLGYLLEVAGFGVQGELGYVHLTILSRWTRPGGGSASGEAAWVSGGGSAYSGGRPA